MRQILGNFFCCDNCHSQSHGENLFRDNKIVSSFQKPQCLIITVSVIGNENRFHICTHFRVLNVNVFDQEYQTCLKGRLSFRKLKKWCQSTIHSWVTTERPHFCDKIALCSSREKNRSDRARNRFWFAFWWEIFFHALCFLRMSWTYGGVVVCQLYVRSVCSRIDFGKNAVKMLVEVSNDNSNEQRPKNQKSKQNSTSLLFNFFA